MKNPLDDLPESPLDAEQEQALAKKNTRQAREKIVLHALRDAVSFMRAVSNGRVETGILLSLAFEALNRSVVNFHAGGQTFLAYSKAYLRGAVYKHYRARDVVKNSSLHETKGPARIVLAVPADSTNGGRNLDGRCTATIDREMTEIEFAEPAVDPDFSAIHAKDSWAIIEPLLPRLLKREQVVIYKHYFEGKNFQEIGNEMGKTSRSWIQMVHASALGKLQKLVVSRKMVGKV